MRVYLDWNATTPPLAEVLDAMHAAARDAWGNPASIHAHGRAARAHVEDARAAVADLAHADPRDVVLTSGGTEANNLALRSAFGAGKGTLLVSRLEHPSITRVAEDLARRAIADVRWIRVREDGRVDLDDVARAIADAAPPVLVALQAVNHETGVIQPTADAIAIARSRGARVHVDAVQAFGRVDDVVADADSRSLAAHKIRGPKGIGALVTKPGLRLEPLLLGGAQERGVRPGTVDPIAAAGLAIAARRARISPVKYAAIAELRDALERALTASSKGARVNGEAPRAPHVTNIAFEGWRGAELVAALDLEGISVSSGSACSAGTIEASPVLTAMLGEARAASSLRFSLGEETTRADIEAAIAAVARVLARGAS
jgi:cysteine desulfurase